MNTEKSTLTRVREAQEALDKARVAMDSVQSGLSTVEKMAEKAESARQHPVRTGGIVFLLATVALGALIGIKSVTD
jgi:predicted neutral ceramidase superfamily lipid hydrolase